jgi:hypothetical protein
MNSSYISRVAKNNEASRSVISELHAQRTNDIVARQEAIKEEMKSNTFKKVVTAKDRRLFKENLIKKFTKGLLLEFATNVAYGSLPMADDHRTQKEYSLVKNKIVELFDNKEFRAHSNKFHTINNFDTSPGGKLNSFPLGNYMNELATRMAQIGDFESALGSPVNSSLSTIEYESVIGQPDYQTIRESLEAVINISIDAVKPKILFAIKEERERAETSKELNEAINNGFKNTKDLERKVKGTSTLRELLKQSIVLSESNGFDKDIAFKEALMQYSLLETLNTTGIMEVNDKVIKTFMKI